MKELSEETKQERRLEAKITVDKHILWSMGAGSIPIPVVDMIGVSAIQLDMLKQICKIYDVDYADNKGKSLVSAIAGGALARLGASALKAIPVIGTVIGGISMVILSGASNVPPLIRDEGSFTALSPNGARLLYPKWAVTGAM